ncbi:hypothetical protein NIES2101_25775 [Calothrix sp. HK-06]|nr:hypothetical protein NIES2101_25775 [Calothrix sp. HK-06]
MTPAKIHASEYPLHKVFSGDFTFTIPMYQRPYAWGKEQAGELIDDLITALEEGSIKIDEVNPYFLGSIVLIKGDKPDAEIIDGQQRLTTLTILLSVLRELVSPEYKQKITPYIYQSPDFDLDAESTIYRLTLRERDADFFREHIQDEGGIARLESLPNSGLSESRKNIKENTILLKQRLQKFSQENLQNLTKFVLKRCFLVVVSTPDIDSAYRIFSVINNRGLNLSHADIFKSEIIGKIEKDKQDSYSSKWEEIEEKLGREDFKSLFSHIRMIHVKSKPTQSILKEFHEDVKPSPAKYPQEFIDKILIPLANAFYGIKNQSYKSDTLEDKVNQSFRWLSWIDNSDWIPPAILFLSKNYRKPELLLPFFTDLDRLASGLMIQRYNIYERVERYSKLLKAIESEADLYAPDSPLQLQELEKDNILRILNAELYLMKKIRLYVLLRLDAALSRGEAEYKYPTITVEHVLPQKPASDSEWSKWFPNAEEHKKYVHCLGNLVLLPNYKNSEAKNYDFEMKKQKYFKTKYGVSPFALTTQVLNEKQWKPEVIEKRQKDLINIFKELWHL